MKFLLRFMAFLSLTLAGTAHAAFLGPYAVNNWSTTVNGGSIDITGAPNSVTMTSSNSGSMAESYQLFVNQAVADSVISFSWDYYTEDSDGPSFDPFGWFTIDMNNQSSISFNQLTEETMYSDPQDPESPIINSHQWGQNFFNVLAGQTFGFYAYSTDSSLGSAATRIFDFNVEPASPAPVPVPAAIWLIGAPLLGLLSRKRRRTAL